MIGQKTYTVYALRSELNGMVYVGFSDNLERRLKEHNAGKSKFTKGYRPWSLVYSELVNSRLEARQREKYLKSGVGKEWLKDKIRQAP